MKVRVRKITGRRELKRAQSVTQGKFLKYDCKELGDKELLESIISRHGTLNRYIFEVEAEVPKKVHEHLRTHNLVDRFYACSTESKSKENGNLRKISFLLPLARFFEIASIRLCPRAYKETVRFYRILTQEISKIEPAINILAHPRCVNFGYCPELKKSCGYVKTFDYGMIREELLKTVEELKNER